jgi:hypothetical protein
MKGETMKHFYSTWMIIIICLIQTPTIARPNPPVALLVNGTGSLTFSRDGNQWTPINRNKLLFQGDYVKTGNDGSCKLIFHDSDYTKYIENNTHAIVKESDLELLAGNVSESNTKTFNLLDNLRRKFAIIHRYTTVQRSKASKPLFTLPESLLVSKQYPTIAWENIGPQYDYRLIYLGKSYFIPKSDQPIIRFNLTVFKPGKHEYFVSVINNNKEILKKSAMLECLSEKESDAIFAQENTVRQISDQGFLLGHFMDEKGLKIPALDHYLRFFENGKYDDEVYPFLIKVYIDLGMKRIAKKESNIFNQQRK